MYLVPPGTYSSDGSSICTPCGSINGPNEYSDFIGSSECKCCPDGKFNSSLEASMCSNCADGKYRAAIVGNSCERGPCLDCQAGKYTDKTTMKKVCTNCQSGKYSTQMGLSFCNDCGFGNISSPGSISCLQWVFKNCLLPKINCSLGRFSNLSVSDQCLPCAPGNYSNNFGASSCQTCLSGFFANVSGLLTCFPCSPGTFDILKSIELNAF